ncbi:MAG TPA: DNA translocase FtsK [Desulfotomaculum sp.]|nr:MAG: cell division protein FtsK [Desulfotomaculum sp. BICA1-6]HBX22496.1 DNA translocase FtsK [Desulfotomaculum sp.]
MPPVKNMQEEIRCEIIGITLLALAALTLISVVNPSVGLVGGLINRAVLTLAGEGRYFFPLLLAVLGFKMLYLKSKIKKNVNIYGAVIALIVALTLLHMPIPKDYILKAGMQGDGGGLIGGIIYYVLLNSFGSLGMYIVLSALMLVSVLLLTNQSVAVLFRNMTRKATDALKKTAHTVDEFLFITAVEESEDRPEIVDRSQPTGDDRISVENSLNSPAKTTNKTSKEKKSNVIYYRPVIHPEEERNTGELVENEQSKELTLPFDAGDIPELIAPIDETGRGGKLPPLSILTRPVRGKISKNNQDIADNIKRLEEILASFGIRVRVTKVSRGPVITRYEVQPPPGVKVSRIVSLADDIALGMAASDVRIEAPVPGKAVVGIEVPNREVATVYLRELVETVEFQQSPSFLTIALGKDVAGNPILDDLSRMPHLLIAGATGAGKSVCLNTLIAGILFKSTPDQVKFLIIDPKMVELATFNGIPHLVSPVVTDPRKSATSLRWAVKEMEYRYELFAGAEVRDLTRYNNLMRREGKVLLPQLVIIIDELADLMMVSPADVEDAICRLAQMARAAGIHLVVATQRPSVDIITGLIKANIPSRISFAVSSQIDSRTILDMGGAEKLLGRGDMLFYPVGATKPVRVQGAYLSDREVELLVNFWKKKAHPGYDENLEQEVAAAEDEPEYDDKLLARALQIFVQTGHGSISLLQRRLHIGYARAARLMDIMERRGYVSGHEGSKPRTVLINSEEYQQKFHGRNSAKAGNDK